MSKKNKKIKALQRQIDDLSTRISSLEDLLTNIISKGFSAMFEENMEAYNEHFKNIQSENENCETYDNEDELDFEEDDFLFTAEEEAEEEEVNKKDKKKKNKKDKKKKKKSKKDEDKYDDDEEEEDEEEEEIEAEEESDANTILPNHGMAPIENVAKEKTTKPKGRTPKVKQEVSNINDLRNLNGIGDTLASKLENLGVKNIEDLLALSESQENEINTQIKGFSKKMLTFNWKEQAQTLLDNHQE